MREKGIIKIQKIVSDFSLWKNDFSPYHERENDFLRITFIHSVVAFIISPAYCLIVHFSKAPEIYFYLGLAYTVLFPFYVFICWCIKYFNNKLMYFFISHIFLITVVAFYSLVKSDFSYDQLFMFSGLYVVSILAINRIYPLLLYILLVTFLFLYVFGIISNINQSLYLIIINLFIIGISGFFTVYVRVKEIKTIENYSRYLQNILNFSGSGYVLFQFENLERVIDFNIEIEKIFSLKNSTQQTIKETVIDRLSIKEKTTISELSLGKIFTKRIKLNRFGIPQTIEYAISKISIEKNHYLLARINNITNELAEREAVELSEKKYRNLYEKNKAGVFTVDKHSVIVDGNESFFKMFDSLYQINDRLFAIEYQKDWDLIIESLGTNEYAQNYQTQFTLLNGKEKTFIFNWYLDNKTNNIEGSVIDLTKIQSASLALKQSEEKYRLIYEETNDAILFLDGDKIIDTNKKATQLFGLSQQDLLKLNLYDLSLNKSSESLDKYNKFKENNINSRAVKFDWLFKGNDKKIEAKVVFIEITLGKKLFYQCVIHDNTESNEHIRSIEKNKQNLTNILENHPEGIIICKSQLILFTNPEIDQILGNSIDLKTIFNKGDQELFNTVYNQHLIDRERKNIKLNFIDIHKNEVYMDVTIASTIFEDEEAELIVLKDVSIENKVEREKLRAEIAEDSNKNLAIEIKERIFAEKQLEEQFLRMKAILDSSSNTFLLTLTLDAKISQYNMHCKAYFSKILRKKINKGEELSEYFKDIISEIRLRFFNKTLQEIRKGRSRQFELDIVSNGIHHWLEVFVNPIFNTEGKVSEISLVAHDISEKKKSSIEIESSLKEKEVLLKEIHHRVKNNLQVISSILNLQSSFVEDEKTLAILQESRNRVRTMAIIHENLYRTEDFASINFSNYIENLTGNLISSYRINEEVFLIKELEDVQIVLDQAIPCGLIVNEIITNSLKYAWKKDEKGNIFISLKEEEGIVYIEVSDDGIGLPNDFDILTSDTLGLQLVSTLIEQLDGEINVNSENGTKYLIKFDKIKP